MFRRIPVKPVDCHPAVAEGRLVIISPAVRNQVFERQKKVDGTGRDDTMLVNEMEWSRGIGHMGNVGIKIPQ